MRHVQATRERRALIAWLVALDSLAIAAALLASSLIVERLGTWRDPLAHGWLARHPAAFALAVPLWLAVFALSHLYRRRYLLLGSQEYAKILSASTAGVMALAVGSIFLPGPAAVSPVWLAVTWVCAVGIVGLERFTFRRVINRLQRRGRFLSRALVVGTNEQSKTVARLFHA
ncbi:MAG: hypothetical protein IRY97_00680, partial [Thermomicrobiaceae bacterium]|nr:hypothetical protein [Thermomicrobiaceae bacterium]